MILNTIYFCYFCKESFFPSKNGRWLYSVRKEIFNRNFIGAPFNFSLYLWSANWWKPGSGTTWKLRMQYGHLSS